MAAEFAPAGPGGMAGNHADPDSSSRPVAPATAGELNTFRPGLFPIACWRLDDVRFDFDSSFVRPEATLEIKLLAALIRQHPGAPLSVFGHADPVGNDDYNKTLSGRRASAVYAVLTRHIDVWESLYLEPYKGDHWGVRTIQIMLDALGYSPGPIDGVITFTRSPEWIFTGENPLGFWFQSPPATI